jgi:uncharacterized protein YutE (UPF0331/DUF86 family)
VPTASQPDDVTLAKAANIERCIRRFRAEYAAILSDTDFTHLDAMLLNIERACQAAIDLAMHMCAQRHLGIPQGTGQAFDLLREAGLIDEQICRRLKGMVGYRNVAIHAYTALDPGTTRWITETGYRDFIAFLATLGVHIVVDG